VAEWAQKYNKPMVTVDCKFDDPIFAAASATIISAEYLRDTYAENNIDAIIEEYKHRSNGITIFTFGHEEIRYAFREENFNQFTPYQIEPIDTTGAGDAFRAGIIFGLLKEWSISGTIPFASALAAMVCQSLPGVLNSPSYEQVQSFMENYELKG
jgi:sugar/nucleoside kinase (ribokinase family)